MTIMKLGIFFLEVSRIRQNNAAQIDRRRSRINRAHEALLYQARNPATVVEVGVRQDQTFDVFRRDRQVLPVPLAPFLLALEKTAVY